MKILIAIMFCLLSANLSAQQPAASDVAVRFLTVDIFVDTKDKPLAAYQIEFSATNTVAKIVGIEGGEHPAFRDAPYYDPKALQQERVILAAFSTEPDNRLPTGKTRVATIHLQVRGVIKPQFELKLQAAADSNGKKLAASATLKEGRN